MHILGPAFGCASIDPQCSAAVALLRAWEKRTGGQWQLVCAADDFDLLPLLEVEGRKVSGFREIAQYLDGTTRTRKAEHISIEAFVESHGQTLIDIAYYVSYENYSGRTRPGFTKILPWYANYIVPPQRRAAARDRTRHLGISGIDMDDVHESVLDDKPPENMSLAEQRFDKETEKRARGLLGRKSTVRSMLRRPEHSGTFKLKNLADNFYEPLMDMIQDTDSDLTEDEWPSPAACFAFGYLSLLANRTLPQSWASDIMLMHYKPLADFVTRLTSKLDVRIDDAAGKTPADLVLRGKGGGLPWVKTPDVSFGNKMSFCGHALLGQIPLLPEHQPVRPAKAHAVRSTMAIDYLPQAMFSSIASIALGGWVAYRLGFWPQGEEVHLFGRKRLSDYGAAGAALSVLGNL